MVSQETRICQSVELKIMSDLTTRIHQYYDLINRGQYFRAFIFLDDKLSNPLRRINEMPSSVYQDVIKTFRDAWGNLEIGSIVMEVHLEETPNFAVGFTKFKSKDRSGYLEENWVFSKLGVGCTAGRYWFNSNFFPKFSGGLNG